jgi:hypothetical protein
VTLLSAKNCYCIKKAVDVGLSTFTSKLSEAEITKIKNDCGQLIVNYIIKVSVIIASIIAVPIINIILGVILKALAAIYRPVTKSKHYLNEIKVIFWAYFINTAVIVLFLNADLT